MGWLDQLRQAGEQNRAPKIERVIVAPPKRESLKVHETYVVTRQPRGNDPGQLEPIYYTVDDQRLLTLTNRNGVAIELRGDALVYLLKTDEDPVTMARMLARKRREDEDTAFNRPLDFQPNSVA